MFEDRNIKWAECRDVFCLFFVPNSILVDTYGVQRKSTDMGDYNLGESFGEPKNISNNLKSCYNVYVKGKKLPLQKDVLEVGNLSDKA